MGDTLAIIRELVPIFGPSGVLLLVLVVPSLRRLLIPEKPVGSPEHLESQVAIILERLGVLSQELSRHHTRVEERHDGLVRMVKDMSEDLRSYHKAVERRTA